MQGYNCIMVYSQDGKRLLFCKRRKDPYKGLYNLVGGKIEKNEDGYDAAYRELKEETGIVMKYPPTYFFCQRDSKEVRHISHQGTTCPYY